MGGDDSNRDDDGDAPMGCAAGVLLIFAAFLVWWVITTVKQ